MISFFVCGHENILSAHRTTIEFTRESHLTKNGDCILGVSAEFDLEAIRESLKDAKEISVMIEANGIRDEISCTYNPGFNDSHEMVIRKTGFVSGRTLGIMADKSASDINRSIILFMKNHGARAKITIMPK